MVVPCPEISDVRKPSKQDCNYMEGPQFQKDQALAKQECEYAVENQKDPAVANKLQQRPQSQE